MNGISYLKEKLNKSIKKRK